MRAKSARDRKAAKAQTEKDARKKARQPEPVPWVGRDQQRISTFLHHIAADYCDDDDFAGCEAELLAVCSDSVETDYGNEDFAGCEAELLALCSDSVETEDWSGSLY